MLRSLTNALAILGLTAGLTACAAPNANTSQYYSGQAMQASAVEYGTIVSGRYVELRGVKGDTDLFAGAALGGIAGALVGEKFGKGTGKTIMTGAGAIAGAAAGSSLAKNANRTTAQEWTIRLDNGKTISVVQTDSGLAPGVRVRVIQNAYETRVVRDF